MPLEARSFEPYIVCVRTMCAQAALGPAALPPPGARGPRAARAVPRSGRGFHKRGDVIVPGACICACMSVCSTHVRTSTHALMLTYTRTHTRINAALCSTHITRAPTPQASRAGHLPSLLEHARLLGARGGGSGGGADWLASALQVRGGGVAGWPLRCGCGGACCRCAPCPRAPKLVLVP